MSQRRIWPFVTTAALGFLILCGLGIWQVQRLAYKEALLAEIDARGLAEPVDLSEAVKRLEAGKNIEFLKISARGQFLHGSEKRLFGVFNGAPAWEVVTPMVTADQTLLLVDRGFVPDNVRIERAPEGDVAVTGLLRTHGGKRGFFSPDNDSKANMWFWWDVPAMLADTPVPSGIKSLSLALHLLPVAGEGGFPRPAEPKAAFRNHHLGYAITWFSLAAVLAVIAFLFIRGEMKKSGA
ncbi:MAG: SURF1 family protein [Aestuariivirga sp.]